MQVKPKLWTSSFIASCVGNFMLFFAFYLLLPILPLYLIDTFAVSKSVIGILLSCYTIAALCVRPFSGFILDRFRRKPIYLMAYCAFMLIFVGYAEAQLIATFALMRALHGLAFGLVTTAGNTIVIDIMPTERRGEGLGYFGISNTLAMSIGPMISLFLANNYSYTTIFYFALVMGFIGFCTVSTIRVPIKETTPEPPTRPLHSYDRFFLVEGFRAGLCLLLLAIPYGMTTTYIAIYGRELGIENGMGAFFSIMAVGLIFSRFTAGRLIDQGYLTSIIKWGNSIGCVSFLALSTLLMLDGMSHTLSHALFYSIPLFLGLAYGMLFPAFNTLFYNLAPNSRRATAASTFLTSWDLGIGIGLMLGGRIADTLGGLPLSYFVGGISATIGLVFFVRVAVPHFEKNKLR